MILEKITGFQSLSALTATELAVLSGMAGMQERDSVVQRAVFFHFGYDGFTVKQPVELIKTTILLSSAVVFLSLFLKLLYNSERIPCIHL